MTKDGMEMYEFISTFDMEDGSTQELEVFVPANDIRIAQLLSEIYTYSLVVAENYELFLESDNLEWLINTYTVAISTAIDYVRYDINDYTLDDVVKLSEYLTLLIKMKAEAQ